jgi:hypothetical protein
VIVAAEIVVGPQPTAEVLSAADMLAEACRGRGFPVHRLAAPTAGDNRLCLYLSTADAGYPVAGLLDHGVRRDAFARLTHTQYLVRSWRGEARLHIALAARTGEGLKAAARLVAARIAGKEDFTHLDVQGPTGENAE